MNDQELKEIKEKLDKLVQQQSGNNTSTLSFLFTAGMPVLIAVIGIVFTIMNNRRQIEFQQIQVADKMVEDVQQDADFTKDKLDLKLLFVESMFQDQRFKKKVQGLLSQTYAISLQRQSSELNSLAQSGDPEDVKYVQSVITEAKKFNDSSINNVVNKLEQKPAIRNITKPGTVKDQNSQENDIKKDSSVVKAPGKPVTRDTVKSNSPTKQGQGKDGVKGKKNIKKKPGE